LGDFCLKAQIFLIILKDMGERKSYFDGIYVEIEGERKKNLFSFQFSTAQIF
jgi:hypothetical protein